MFQKFGRSIVILFIAGIFISTGAAFAQQVTGVPEPVAKVNGQPISRDLYLTRLLQYHGVYILENLLGEKLLEAEAKKRGVVVTEEEINKKVEELKKASGIKSADSFRSWLLQNEWTEARYRDKARLIVMVEKTFAREANVTDQEVATYYDKNKAAFTVPASAKMWVLMTRTEELAQKGLQLLKAGKDFPTVAKELGPGMAETTPQPNVWPISGLIPTMRAAVERAPLNQPYGPVKVPQNPQDPSSPAAVYQIIKVESREPERIRPFAEVKDDIRRAIFDERMFGNFGIWNRWLEQERQKASIERYFTFQGEPKIDSGKPKPAATNTNK